MTKTEQALAITVIGLIALTALNFGADWIFRSQQIEINSDFLFMHNSTTVLTEALSRVVLNLNEKMDIVLDELFDKVWEDLAQI